MRVHEYAKAQALLMQIVEFSTCKKTLEECVAEAAKYKAEQDAKKGYVGCLIIVLFIVLCFVLKSC